MPGSSLPLSRILLVSAERSTTQALSKMLGGVARVQAVAEAERALHLAAEQPPDLLLLDTDLPGSSGIELCKRLKSHPQLATAPVVLLTRHSEPAFELEGFAVGAADFIAKPLNAPLVLARVKAQLTFKRMADELRLMARRDALTGVANRTAFDEALIQEWRRSIRHGHALALLLVDLDHFQAYNQRYGQAAGDDCLCKVARALGQAAGRPGDLVARIGGEEFALLLTQTNRTGAEHLAHRVLDAVEALQLPHEGSTVARHMTVSIGIGCYDESSPLWVGSSPEGRDALADSAGMVHLAQAADAALLAAKKGGRAHAFVLDLADFDNANAVQEIGPKR